MRIKNQQRLETFLVVLVLLLFSLGTIWGLYKGSTPKRYALSPGEVSSVDILSTRQLVDEEATLERAELMAQMVQPVLTRSADLAETSVKEITAYFNSIDALRHDAYTDDKGEKLETLPRVKQERLIDAISEESEESFGFSLNPMTAETLGTLSPSIYAELKHQTLRLAKELMAENHDRRSLDSAITNRITQVVSNLDAYSQDFESIAVLLRFFLRPNLEFDLNATESAREAAYQQALADPVIIEPGTKIVKAGDQISERQYAQLEELDLLQDQSLDWRQFGSLVGFFVLITSVAALYLLAYDRERFHRQGSILTLLVPAAIALLAGILLSHFSSLLIPITFFSILCTTYFGLRTSLVMSSLLILLFLPVVPGDVRYFFVSFVSAWATSLVTALNRRRNNYTMVIMAATVSNILAIAVYGLLFAQTWQQLSQDLIYGLLNGSLSAVAAIGLIPLVEFSRAAVAPTRLIALSEPSNPLLKTLFLEAPGTNQHSMMVANLAAAAAEAIGANSLLCRVGAYYHDIGKLENPMMFTENQNDLNPHDDLDPHDSYEIIIAHVEDGLKMARRYRLPEPIQAMIREHHGTTVLSYFYKKACRQAEELGEPMPDPDDYRYPWNIPQSKEAAILMLADSLEAAMKSTHTDNLEDMRILARKILKGKNDEDQLKESGLSYQEVEDILEAFALVYQGQFHERVSYDDNESNQSQTVSSDPVA